jgi:hypothetical protein
MRTKLLLLSLAALTASPAAAQAVIDPGMTKAQVIAKLGPPAVVRTTDVATFLFYRNGSERRVGMNDVVILEDDKVVDAVLRSAARHYSGKSSSPAAIPPEVARKAKATKAAPPAAPASASAAGGAPSAAPGGVVLPAAKAQQADRAKPMPPARSAILDQAKQDAEAKGVDGKKPEAKPADPKAAAPAKKP